MKIKNTNCTKCGNPKTDDRSWCKDCRSKYLKEYRKNNAEKCKKLAQRWNSENKEYITEFKYKKRGTFHGRMVETCRLARRRAARKGMEYNLTVEFLEDMWNKQNGKCALTGLPMIIPVDRNDGKTLPFTPSIDKIDVKKGYTKDNVRLLCHVVNSALNEYGDETFDKIAKAYVLGIMPVIKEEPRIEPPDPNRKWDTKYREGKTGTVQFLYMKSKKRAEEEYKVEFKITKEFISKLLDSGKCAITNIPIRYELNKSGLNPFRPSLDRIDSTKGYTEDNIRIVCIAANYALNEFGIDIFDKICKTYLENKNT